MEMYLISKVYAQAACHIVRFYFGGEKNGRRGHRILRNSRLNHNKSRWCLPNEESNLHHSVFFFYPPHFSLCYQQFNVGSKDLAGY